MDRNRKEQLKKIFEAPEPVGKRKFFRDMEPKPVNMCHILKVQFSYISKCSWGVAVLLFGIVVYLSHFYEQEMLGIVLSMMPFLALVGISESVRSSVYGMEELEMSSRFSLKSILLVRMAVIGIEDILLALVFAWSVQGDYGRVAGQGTFFRTVIYLFVPYLLSVFGSLWIVRNFAGKDELYACAGLALAVSAASFSSTKSFAWIYQEEYLPVWLCAVIVLGGLALYEGRKMLRVAEGFA